MMLALWLLLSVVLPSTAQEPVKAKKQRKETVFQYFFGMSDIPKFVISADFSKMRGNKYMIDKMDANLKFEDEGQAEEWDIKISMRGKSRRTICDLPPLRLHFPKKTLSENGIRKKHNTLKLVSYCKDKSTYEYYILREYLAYKMYNKITDYSFNVQLVEVEYKDTGKRSGSVTRYGFIIENTDEMADRLNAKEKSKYLFGRDSLNHFQYDLLALFQYSISNTDWRISALHNTKIIRDKDTKEFFAIPYDFDYSGFVNTEYSIPSPDFRQVSIYSRIFMGDCREYEIMEKARAVYIDKKDEVLQCPDEWPFKSKHCKKALKFVKRSYKILEKDKTFKNQCLRKSY